MSRNLLRFSLVAIIVIGVVATGAYLVRAQVKPDRGNLSIPIVKPEVATHISSFIADGSIRPSQTVEVSVSPGFTGQVMKVDAHEGDYVHKGQILAELESPDIRIKLQKAQETLKVTKEAYHLILNPYRPDEIQRARLAVQLARSGLEKAKEALAILVKGTRSQLIEKADADYKAALATQAQTKLTASRYKTLVAQHLLPQMEYDQASTAASVADEAVAAASAGLSLAKEGPLQEDIREARDQVRIAETSLAVADRDDNLIELGSRQEAIKRAWDEVLSSQADVDQAESDFSHRFVKSPADGRVLTTAVVVGQFIAPIIDKQPDNSQPVHNPSAIFQLAVDDKYDFLANVEQDQVGSVKVGEEVQVQLGNSLATTAKGFVYQVAPIINPDLNSSHGLPSSTNPDTPYTFNVWIHLSGDISTLRSNLSGFATFRRAVKGVWVPESTLTTYSQSQGSVYVAKNNRIVVTPVSYGETSEGETRILSGISTDDEVVADNSLPLKNGQTIHGVTMTKANLGSKNKPDWPLVR